MYQSTVFGFLRAKIKLFLLLKPNAAYIIECQHAPATILKILTSVLEIHLPA